MLLRLSAKSICPVTASNVFLDISSRQGTDHPASSRTGSTAAVGDDLPLLQENQNGNGRDCTILNRPGTQPPAADWHHGGSNDFGVSSLGLVRLAHLAQPGVHARVGVVARQVGLPNLRDDGVVG